MKVPLIGKSSAESHQQERALRVMFQDRRLQIATELAASMMSGFGVYLARKAAGEDGEEWKETPSEFPVPSPVVIRLSLQVATELMEASGFLEAIGIGIRKERDDGK